MPETPPTPTLDKMLAVHAQSQAIGEFVEWLRERDIVLAENRREATYVCATCGTVAEPEVKRASINDDESWRHATCRSTDNAVDRIPAGLYPNAATLTTLLHEFFDIDAAAAERERRALLAHARAG